MKHFPLVVGLAVIGMLLWSGYSQSQGWKADTNRVLQGVKAREDSATAQLAKAESLTVAARSVFVNAERTALRGQQAYRSALNLRDSLEGVAIPDTCLPLASGWRRSFDSLLVGYDSLQGAFVALRGSYAAQDTALTLLRSAYDLRGESIDSLASLVRRTPTGCRVLGLPCPVVVGGYGAVVSGGVVRTGPSVSVGIKIPF